MWCDYSLRKKKYDYLTLITIKNKKKDSKTTILGFDSYELISKTRKSKTPKLFGKITEFVP